MSGPLVECAGCGHVARVHGSRPGMTLPDNRCRAARCPCLTFRARPVLDVQAQPDDVDVPHRASCSRPVVERTEPMRGWQLTRCRSCGAASAARRTS